MSIDLNTLWGLTDDALASLSPTARADLEAATRLLERYIKSDRVHDVVRRPSPTLDGGSLIDFVRAGRFARMHAEVADMFDLRRIAP
jgi:hypothetical protein